MTERPKKVIVDKFIGSKQDIGTVIIEDKDASLYALGVGFNMDPIREEDFKYVNEWNEQFTTLPTITSTMLLKRSVEMILNSPFIPEFGLHQLLHAQEKLFMIHKSIKIGIGYRMEIQAIDAIDKGKNAFFYVRQTGYANNDKNQEEKAFYIDHCMFVRGIGGFNSKGTGIVQPIPDLPKRNPDHVFKDRTYPSQALVFRLTGDVNPLHIDPNMAQAAGFDRPIIHGMASYGVVARNLVQNCLENNPQRLKSYETRLIGHIFPGQALEISVWKEGDRIYFLAETAERKTKALVGVMTTREQAKL